MTDAYLLNVNTSVNTSYAQARPVKPKMEKKKSLFTPKFKQPIILNPNMMGSEDFAMPSGSGLDINKGYLNKIKKQQEKRDERHGTKTILGTSLPNIQPLSVQSGGFQPLKQEPEAKPVQKLEAIKTTNPLLKNNRAISIARVAPPAPPPPPPPPTAKDQAALQRLKGLGLTVSVGTVRREGAPPPAPAPPTRPPTTQPQQARQVDLSRFLVPEQQQQQQQQQQRVQAQPRPPVQKSQPQKPRTQKAPAQKPPATQKPPAQSPAATAFSDSQKLQLKSQLLAYRLLARAEEIKPVVLLAATSRLVTWIVILVISCLSSYPRYC